MQNGSRCKVKKMSTPVNQREFNATHHEAICRRLVKLASQEIVNVKKVK